MGMMEDRQVWPVENVHKPACGVRGHAHPREMLWGCFEAMEEGVEMMRDPDGRPSAVGRGFADAFIGSRQVQRESFHRAMCEPFTNLRDLDDARELEARSMAAARKYTGGGGNVRGA